MSRAEEGVAVYKGHGDFIATLHLIPAENKTNVATSISRILPKGTEVGTVPSFAHRSDFFIQCFN